MTLKGNFDKERPPIIKLGHNNIKFYTEYKYLGILIDNKLNFIAHTKYIREKLVTVSPTSERAAARPSSYRGCGARWRHRPGG